MLIGGIFLLSLEQILILSRMKHAVRAFPIFLLLVFAFPSWIEAQEYYRISADFTVKIRRSDGSMNLTRGTVFYDKNIGELIYRVTFPQPEVWVMADTSLFKFREDSVYQRISIPSINKFTIFHLSLNSGLSDFGMKKSLFKVSKVEKKNGMVLSYWKIPDKAESSIDHVVVAKKENRLESVIMIGKESQVLSRQFFRDYISIGAFEFPSQIVQVIPSEGGDDNYQVTEFRNVKVNDMENEAMFRYQIPPGS